MKNGYDVILKPIITEQSMDMSADKKYVFRVADTANKTEVRQAVEDIFGVEVAKVNIMNVNGKVKRMGRSPLDIEVADTDLSTELSILREIKTEFRQQLRLSSTTQTDLQTLHFWFMQMVRRDTSSLLTS